MENSFATWQDISTDRDECQEDEFRPEDVELLHYPPQDTFSYQSIDADLPPFQLEADATAYSSGLDGIWTGHCYHTDFDGERVSVKGLLMVRITNIEGGSLSGKVESCSGRGEVSGSVEGEQGAPRQVEIILHNELGGNTLYRLSGTFDPVAQTIIGTYEVEGEDEDEGEDEEEEEEEEGGEEEEGEEEEKEEDQDGDGSKEDGEEEQVDEGEESGDVDEEAYKKEVEAQIGTGVQQGQNEDEQQSETNHADEGPEDEDTQEDDGKDDETEEESQEYFTFTLTRTPPEFYRFRYSPEEFQENAAKARWAFACKAALYHVKKKRWTWPFLKERIAERRRVVELRLRSWDEDNGLAPCRSLTAEEDNELDKLDDSMSPTVSGLCWALVEYLSDREAYLL